MTTTQKQTFQYQWFISTLITVLTIGAGFVYNRGVQAQQMKDTTQAIEERKKADDNLMQCIKDEKKEQALINEKLLSTLTTLQMTLVEIQTEIKLKRDRN